MVEHTELAWLLTAVTAYGDLQRMTQFKEKSAAQRELVSAGLFVYPVLMAADVLAYRADEVPVGDDQRQHLELMRDIALRFNARFGDTLVVPEARIPAVGARIMDLQNPAAKMSTTSASEEGTLYVLDEPALIERKLKRAVTDSGEGIVRAPDKPGITNLIDILAVVRGVGTEEIERDFASAALRRPEGRARRRGDRIPRARARALRAAARGRGGPGGGAGRRRGALAHDRRRHARRRARRDGRRPAALARTRWASRRPVAAAPRRGRLCGALWSVGAPR